VRTQIGQIAALSLNDCRQSIVPKRDARHRRLIVAITQFAGWRQLAPEPTPSEIIIKLIVLAAAGVGLAIGAAVGLALSSTANPKLVVSCEGSSCSVQLPGAVLDEMNQTKTNTVAKATKSEKSDKQTFLKEVGKLFERPPTQHDSTVEDSGAELVFKRLFQ
jgi:hypothetical protein